MILRSDGVDFGPKDGDPMLTRKAAKRYESVRPYCKPTQVGRERILRCLSETRLRNSAN